MSVVTVFNILTGLQAVLLAALEEITDAPMIVCFGMFLLNDLYGFLSWKAREVRQRLGRPAQELGHLKKVTAESRALKEKLACRAEYDFIRLENKKEMW